MTKEDLLKRTKAFSVRIVKMVRSLNPDFATKVLMGQIIRSGTSVGANYRAACIAKSERDFINKLKIVEEELDETIYWMEIFIDAEIIKKEKLSELMQEGQELFKIISRSIKTLKSKSAKPKL
jgi:four helix bundle protein